MPYEVNRLHCCRTFSQRRTFCVALSWVAFYQIRRLEMAAMNCKIKGLRCRRALCQRRTFCVALSSSVALSASHLGAGAPWTTLQKTSRHGATLLA